MARQISHHNAAPVWAWRDWCRIGAASAAIVGGPAVIIAYADAGGSMLGTLITGVVWLSGCAGVFAAGCAPTAWVGRLLWGRR